MHELIGSLAACISCAGDTTVNLQTLIVPCRCMFALRALYHWLTAHHRRAGRQISSHQHYVGTSQHTTKLPELAVASVPCWQAALPSSTGQLSPSKRFYVLLSDFRVTQLNGARTTDGITNTAIHRLTDTAPEMASGTPTWAGCLTRV